MTFNQLSNEVQNVLRVLRGGFEALYGARLKALYVYGSHARGTGHEASDIDVLVVLEGPVRPGHEITRMGPIASKVSLDFNVLVSLVPMDEVEFRTGHQPFVENVRLEAVAV